MAQAQGLNANIVHAWRRQEHDKLVLQARGAAPAATEFIALPLAPLVATALSDIGIEPRRGATSVSITWPGQAASECGA